VPRRAVLHRERRGRCGEQYRRAAGDEIQSDRQRKAVDDRDRVREDHYRPKCRAITIRCTSFVPSPISWIFWSRYCREIAYSSM